MAVIEVSVNHFLAFLEPDGKSNITGVSLTDNLNLSHTIRNQYQIASAKNFFNVGHVIGLRTSKYHVSVSHYLDLHQKAGRTHHVEVVHGFYPYSTAKTVEYGYLVQTLGLSQSIDVTVSKPANNTLVFTQSIEVNCVRSRSVSDSLDFVSEVNVWQPDKYKYSIDIPDVSGPNSPEC